MAKDHCVQKPINIAEVGHGVAANQGLLPHRLEVPVLFVSFRSRHRPLQAGPEGLRASL